MKLQKCAKMEKAKLQWDLLLSSVKNITRIWNHATLSWMQSNDLKTCRKGYTVQYNSRVGGHSMFTLSLSNLNHFQLAYIFSSSSNGSLSVGRGSSFFVAETVRRFCLYFFAICFASENTLCSKESTLSCNYIFITLRGI